MSRKGRRERGGGGLGSPSQTNGQEGQAGVDIQLGQRLARRAVILQQLLNVDVHRAVGVYEGCKSAFAPRRRPARHTGQDPLALSDEAYCRLALPCFEGRKPKAAPAG